MYARVTSLTFLVRQFAHVNPLCRRIAELRNLSGDPRTGLARLLRPAIGPVCLVMRSSRSDRQRERDSMAKGVQAKRHT